MSYVETQSVYFIAPADLITSAERNKFLKMGEGGPHDVMVKAMDFGIVVSELELQSRYYVHLRKNTFGKGMNPLILLAMG